VRPWWWCRRTKAAGSPTRARSRRRGARIARGRVPGPARPGPRPAAGRSRQSWRRSGRREPARSSSRRQPATASVSWRRASWWSPRPAAIRPCSLVSRGTSVALRCGSRDAAGCARPVGEQVDLHGGEPGAAQRQQVTVDELQRPVEVTRGGRRAHGFRPAAVAEFGPAGALGRLGGGDLRAVAVPEPPPADQSERPDMTDPVGDQVVAGAQAEQGVDLREQLVGGLRITGDRLGPGPRRECLDADPGAASPAASRTATACRAAANTRRGRHKAPRYQTAASRLALPGEADVARRQRGAQRLVQAGAARLGQIPVTASRSSACR
jgi:hypothetical protein